MASVITFKTLIHVKSIFEWFKIGVYFYSAACEYLICPVPFIEEISFFSIEYSWFSYQTLVRHICLGLSLGF